MAVVRNKIVAWNHRKMIRVGAEVTMVTGKVDVVNAGDEFTHSQESLLGTGFHSMMFTPEDPA
jgi:hypothetical protein